MSEQHKLTAQMVAAYPNAQVREIETGAIYALLAISIHQNKLSICLTNTPISKGNFVEFLWDAGQFQLVLTSPDKITDAQALEVAKEYYPGMYHAHNVEHILYVFKRYNQNVRCEGKYATELSDISRSLNIDMGYKNIPSLIAAGLAVEKINE